MKRPKAPHSSLVQVAVIAASHGLRGQIKLRSFTQVPQDVFSYSPLKGEDGVSEFAISYKGGKGEVMIASVEGVHNRNEADLLKGTPLFAAITQLPERDENEWLYEELKGLEARLEDGSVYGKIVDVCNYGAGDIIEIKRLDGEAEMLLFNKDFVSDISMDDGYVIIIPPEYIEDKKA